MRRHPVLSVFIVLALLMPLVLVAMACSSGTSETPSEVAEQAIQAIAAGDCEKIVELSASSMIDEDYDGDRDAAVQDCQQGMDTATNVEGVGKITFEVSDFEVVEENIDGDNATVKYKAVVRTKAEGIDEEQTDEDEIKLVKEGNTWKVKGMGV